jgi:hypothetical protein
MGRPAGEAKWAENATFTRAAVTWNGDPTKVQPDSVLLDEGFEPTLEIPVEMLNHHLNEVAALARYVSPIQVGSWERLADPSGVGVNEAFTCRLAPSPIAGRSNRLFVGVAAGGGYRIIMTDDDGVNSFLPTVDIPATVNVLRLRSKDSLTIWASGDIAAGSGDVYRSVDSGINWASVTPGWAGARPAFPLNRTPIHYDPTTTTLVAATLENAPPPASRYQFSVNDGTTWNLCATPPDLDIWDLDGDSAGLFLAAGSATATNGGGIWSSVDGTNWVERLDLGAAGRVTSVAWSSGAGRFVAVGLNAAGTAASWVSTNGISWAEFVTPPVELANIASDNGWLWVAQPFSGAQPLYYSFDGQSWFLGRTMANGFGYRALQYVDAQKAFYGLDGDQQLIRSATL